MSSWEQIKANKNYHSAAIILVLVLLWMLTGLLGDDQPSNNATSTTEPSSDKLFSVRAKQISAQPYTPQLRLSARTETNRTVNVKAEVGGQVIKLPVVKGKLVKQGDVICELAVEDRQLRVEQAKAEVNKAQLEYDASLRLKTSGFQAKTVIAAKKSELETAKANLERSKIDLDKIKIRAPFDGVVDARPVEIGDLVQRGDICATVLDFDPLIVAGQVAGANIHQINTGDEVTAFLLTGEQVQGRIRFIGSSADNLTRTFKVEAEVNNPHNLLHSGITADILLAAPTVSAHLISPSLLSLDDQGKIGVRILDDSHHVNFVHVNLLGDDSNGVWVSGLPEQATLITVGQEYVSHGQLVNVTMETEAANLVQKPLNHSASPATESSNVATEATN